MALVSALETTFNRVGAVSLQAVAVVLLILIVQRVFRRMLTPGWRYGLWGILLARLILLWAPPAPWSMFNAAHSFPPIQIERAAQSELPSSAPPAASSPATIPYDVPVFGTARPISEDTPWPRAIPMLPVLWITGVMVAAGAFARQWKRGRRLCRDSAVLSSGDVEELLDACCHEIGLPRCPSVRESAEVTGPMVIGARRPVLLLPAGFAQQASRAHLRLVFLHELTHLRRRDLWWDWAVYAMLALHWFNPVLWWSMFRVVADRELACDAAVLQRLTPADRRAYGHALLDLFQRFREPSWAPGLAGIAEKHSLLERRIAMITHFTHMPRWAMAAGVVAVAGLAAVSLTNARVAGQPAGDLAITQPDIWGSSGRDGQPHLFARISNSGVEAVDATVQFLERTETGGTQKISAQQITVPAGGDAVAQVSWPASHGLHAITVAVDPDDLVSESDEANNQAARTIAYAHGQFIHENMLIDDLSQYAAYEPDPNALGVWKSVDFVDSAEEFTPGQTQWKHGLYLEGMVFSEEGGRGVVSMMKGATFPFTKGYILHPGDQTASKYVIRNLQGQDYMFFEWKSGDVTIRGMKPKYYVLKRNTSVPASGDPQAAAWDTHPGYPLLKKAEDLYNAERFEEAIPVYREVYETYPTWNYAESALEMIGIIKGRQGNHREAVQWLEKAVQEYGNIPGWSETTWYYLGEEYMQVGRNGDAKTAFERTLQMLERNGGGGGFAYRGSKERLEELARY